MIGRTRNRYPSGPGFGPFGFLLVGCVAPLLLFSGASAQDTNDSKYVCGVLVQDTYGALTGWAPKQLQLARMCKGLLRHREFQVKDPRQSCAEFAHRIAQGVAPRAEQPRLPGLSELKRQVCEVDENGPAMFVASSPRPVAALGGAGSDHALKEQQQQQQQQQVQQERKPASRAPLLAQRKVQRSRGGAHAVGDFKARLRKEESWRHRPGHRMAFKDQQELLHMRDLILEGKDPMLTPIDGTSVTSLVAGTGSSSRNATKNVIAAGELKMKAEKPQGWISFLSTTATDFGSWAKLKLLTTLEFICDGNCGFVDTRHTDEYQFIG